MGVCIYKPVHPLCLSELRSPVSSNTTCHCVTQVYLSESLPQTAQSVGMLTDEATQIQEVSVLQMELSKASCNHI